MMSLSAISLPLLNPNTVQRLLRAAAKLGWGTETSLNKPRSVGGRVFSWYFSVVWVTKTAKFGLRGIWGRLRRLISQPTTLILNEAMR